MNCPLVVDLDGTLIKTDLLHESANACVVASPLGFLRVLNALMQGKAGLKESLATNFQLSVADLPFNQGVLAWLDQQKRLGRYIVLATASHKALADQVAAHLGLFDEVLATDAGINLKSAAKRDLLISKFGERGYDYVGNDLADLTVWAAAHKAYVVSSSDALIVRAKALGNVADIFPDGKRPLVPSLLKALRLHQWIKNLLVFVPLVTAHQLLNPVAFWQGVWAFVAFGLVASSVYVLNDLSDLADDRHHVRKKFRPFAAADLSLLLGWGLWPGFLLFGFLLSALFLPVAFSAVLLGYFALTLAYSFKLKQLPILDVLTLAGLYTIRIVAGAAAIAVPVSFWLLAFSLFIFLSLAFIKRFSELKAARLKGHDGLLRGRGYTHQDLELVSSMGAGAGYLSVLVMALYIQDAHTANLYRTPEVIWLACPVLLYWISRAWLIAHRGEMHDDPIVFAIKDRTSWLIGVVFLTVFSLAALI